MAICWAYNKAGSRCELDAGHDGLHSLSVVWTDEECFSPIVHQLPQRAPSLPDGMDFLTIPDGEDAGCLVCDHPMHKRMCPLDGCDCKAGIPK